MLRRSRNGRILHGRRPVSPGRPLHTTARVRPGGPNLRDPAAFAIIRELLAQARERGVRTAVIVVMPNHLHWMVVPRSREALHDATRYFFGQLARRLNALAGRRRGKVFEERYWSTCCRSVRQGWEAAGYVLRNPHRAGLREARGRRDRYTWVDDDTLAADRFLRSVFGLTPGQRAAVIARMTEGRVPFVPLRVRLQPTLPGV